MAVVQNTYTGDGVTVLYSLSFPYLDRSDVKVSVNGTIVTNYIFATDTSIQFLAAPGAGASIRIYRDTDNEETKATIFPGSAIKAQDLNANFSQTLYSVQEIAFRALSKFGDTMLGILNMGGFKITNLGTPTSSTDASTKAYVDGLISTGAANAAAAAASASAAAGSASSAAASYDAFDDRYLGSKATDPALDNDGNALITGAIYFNTSSNVMRVYNGATWQDASANANVLRWRKTAVGGETSLSGADDNAATLTYTVNLEFVYLNGVLLTRGVDYTASNGTSITGLVALEAGDVVEVLSYSSFSLLAAPATSITFTQNGTGAVTRTVDSKLKEVVSVKDFGAVGDGVADDTTAIQSALNTGKNIHIPSGNYLITSTLNFTADNQCLTGEGFALINVASTNPLLNTNMSQLIAGGAVTMLNMGNYKGTQLRNIALNGNKVATNGITVAPASSPLVFNVVVEDVFINDVVTTALDTGYVVDSLFQRIHVNGFHETSAAVTDTGIRAGSTNVSFVGCWLHGCRKSARLNGSISSWQNCTFTSFPFNSAYSHIYYSSNNVAKASFNACYFETNKPVDPNGNQIGALSFTDCFIESQDPSYLIDLNGATAGQLLLNGSRIHETTASTVIRANSPVRVVSNFVAQTQPTFTGTGDFNQLNKDQYRTTGNLVFATAGKGIDFSATANSSGTMTSELFADYEEGTFSPTVVGSTTAGTATYQYGTTGRYTKVGRVVHFEIWISWISGTGTGNLHFGGLPFAANAALPVPGCSIGYFNNFTWTAGRVPYAIVNGTKVEAQLIATGGGNVTGLPYVAAGDAFLSGTYTV